MERGEAAFVSGGPLSLDGQVAVLGLPSALVRQVNRAFGERPRASKTQTRGHGPFTEESLAGAEKYRVDPQVEPVDQVVPQ